MWIFEHFYWILIVLFAIFSALNRSNKSKQKQNPRGMPSFGGDAGRGQREHGEHREIREQKGFSGSPQASPSRRDESAPESGRPAAGEMEPARGRYAETAGRTSPFGGYSEAGPDYDTGEGVSGMWQDDIPDTLEDFNRVMQTRLEQVDASLDRIGQTAPVPASAARAEAPKPVSRLAKEARNGVIWAEILGPPRSKRPYGGRK